MKIGFRILDAVRIAAAFVVLSLLPAAAAEKVALVIGNSAYVNVPPLPNPIRDAASVAGKLTDVGFEVTHIDDLDQIGMVRALQRFKESASQAKVALVYYAGHGIEVNRVNYFVPVDARLAADTDVAFEAVQMEFALNAVAQASDLSLVIVDACRNNPFSASMTRQLGTRSVGRGLSAVEPSGNVLVAYSAKEGTVALDGTGENSPYAQALVDALSTPNLEIGQLFRQVRDSVLTATNGQQEPFTYGSLSSQSFFLNAVAPATPPAPAPLQVSAPAPTEPAPGTDMVELALWGLVKNTDTLDGYQEYLRQYPQGRFAFFARQRIAEIEKGVPSTGGQTELAAKPPLAQPPAAQPQAEPLVVQPEAAQPPLQPLVPLPQPQLNQAVIAPVAPPPAVEPPASLSRDEVRLAQEALTILGYDPGGRDGVAGARTEAAIRKFQGSQGDEPTGLLTLAQFQRLTGAVTDEQLQALRAVTVKKPPQVKKAAVVMTPAPVAPAAKTVTPKAAPAPTAAAAPAVGTIAVSPRSKRGTDGYFYFNDGSRCMKRADLCENSSR
jgi:uncharacterized caspase-like protein